MKPRSLRHRLEKISKILVVIQKHMPEVDCLIDEDKGEHGHIVIHFSDNGISRPQMHALGKDLESKGYIFTVKKSPWLGQINYSGRSDGKPSVIFAVPIEKDRLAINEQTSAEAFQFGP